MRAVGYTRELGGLDGDEETTFMQSERIRRWAARTGYQLLAICSDAWGAEPTRNGYEALLAIVTAGHVDTVVIPTLRVLSMDMIDQEILLADLRRRSVRVAATEPVDVTALDQPSPDPGRALIRMVIEKSRAYREALEHGPSAPSGRPFRSRPLPAEITVELIQAPSLRPVSEDILAS